MNRIFAYFVISLIYMEAVYHIGTFGLSGLNIVLVLAATFLLAAFETVFVGLFKSDRIKKVLFWILSATNFLIFASQVVYYYIFKKPLMIDAAINAGAAALTDFWQVALDGVIKSIPSLLFLTIPFFVAGILLHKKAIVLSVFQKLEFVALGCYAVAGISLSALLFTMGYYSKSEDYGIYQEMYDPEIVVQKFGVLPLFERQFLGAALPEIKFEYGNLGMIAGETTTETEEEMMTETETEDPVDRSPNVLNLDMDALLNHEDEDIRELAEIMQSLTPSNKNEYTGMFEGYNLIYLTAEAFSQYAVSEELTPTLYKMLHEGVVVEDYYIPLWATSTSDGEYVNLTGQIPADQFSMKKTQNNAHPYSLPAYFEAEGVKSFAYHNNSLSYYDRHLTHPNLGYQFKAARLGSCSKDTYGDWIFEMEGANAWPASDYEMMVSTIPEWINEDRFHAYYMTVSGHALYTYEGNSMSAKNRDVVKDLDYSEEMKAYIACNYELEKALTYLVEELEKAGKLENTVIALSADHHPYGLEDAKVDEFVGRELSDLERYKNCVIIWNSQMEPIKVEKTCSSLDLLPTILNLFGFEYDSRLFAGRDMLSDSPSFVVFANRSFMTDSVIYDAKEKTAVSRNGEEVSQEYLKSMKDYVRMYFRYSGGILDDDFFRYVKEAELQNDISQE